MELPFPTFFRVEVVGGKAFASGHVHPTFNQALKWVARDLGLASSYSCHPGAIKCTDERGELVIRVHLVVAEGHHPIFIVPAHSLAGVLYALDERNVKHKTAFEHDTGAAFHFTATSLGKGE